jgi:hypothetical protein
LRLLYAAEPCSRFGVRGALRILQAAIHLGCSQIAAACAGYLESAPWDKADEEEILRIVPCVFLSSFRLATRSSAAGPARELKSAAQEELEYDRE